MERKNEWKPERLTYLNQRKYFRFFCTESHSTTTVPYISLSVYSESQHFHHIRPTKVHKKLCVLLAPVTFDVFRMLDSDICMMSPIFPMESYVWHLDYLLIVTLIRDRFRSYVKLHSAEILNSINSQFGSLTKFQNATNVALFPLPFKLYTPSYVYSISKILTFEIFWQFPHKIT